MIGIGLCCVLGFYKGSWRWPRRWVALLGGMWLWLQGFTAVRFFWVNGQGSFLGGQWVDNGH